jgi:hypothetical protein
VRPDVGVDDPDDPDCAEELEPDEADLLGLLWLDWSPDVLPVFCPLRLLF